MSRYVSFGVLIAIILILGIMFYRVMASFILPLFLATVLVVVFGPVHKWVLSKTEGRRVLAGVLTTTIISLAVLVPVGAVGLIAFGEARYLFKSLTLGGIDSYSKRVRKSLRLEMPAPVEFRTLDKAVRAMDIRNVDELELTRKQLDRIDDGADRFELALPILKRPEVAAEWTEQSQLKPADLDLWLKFREALQNGRELQVQVGKWRRLETDAKLKLINQEPLLEPENSAGESKMDADAVAQKSTAESDGSEVNSPSSLDSEEADLQELESRRQQSEADCRTALEQILATYESFRSAVLGGSFYAYLKDIANPSPEEFAEYNDAVVKWIKENFLSLGGRASQFLFSIIFNVLIMMIGVYFFLVDGPKMLAAIKYFSPLDDRHEQELVEEFGVVSRAVMVATLAAASVQGILAGIGYYFAGVNAVFLLTMLTGVLAMVPFVGATAVWLPTCLYLYLVEDRLVAAVLLAIWGAGVVSTIDNLIKPLILHGQSNIHPLLALLSVLGGVATLGPLGILVGPMVVAFLQTLLAIFQRELRELDRDTNGADTVGQGAELAEQNNAEPDSRESENEKTESSGKNSEEPEHSDSKGSDSKHGDS